MYCNSEYFNYPLFQFRFSLRSLHFIIEKLDRLGVTQRIKKSNYGKNPGYPSEMDLLNQMKGPITDFSLQNLKKRAF